MMLKDLSSILVDAEWRIHNAEHVADVRNLIAVVEAAYGYRTEEQAQTPRMIRGAKLQRLADRLDEMLKPFIADEVL